MTRFAATTLDLSTLPAPDALESIAYEVLLAAAIERFRVQWELARVKNPALPEFDTINLESEPVRKLLEAETYGEMLFRQRVNEAVKACMVATATGADLQNLGLFFGCVQAPGEDQEVFRRRIVLAPEGFATAGPVGAYQFHALTADPVAIKDVAVLNPAPGKVQVVIQAAAGDGSADKALLAKVLAALNKEEIIPHTDMVSIVSTKVRTYSIDAGLILYPGPDATTIKATAIAAATAYAASVSKIGQDVTLSGLYGALQRPGVQRVNLRGGFAGLVIADNEASFCTGINITVDGRDE